VTTVALLLHTDIIILKLCVLVLTLIISSCYTEILLLQPFYNPLDLVQDYPGEEGKNQSGFTGARDSEWQWHQLGHMQICVLPQTDNYARTPPLIFYRLDALPAAQPTASKH